MQHIVTRRILIKHSQSHDPLMCSLVSRHALRDRVSLTARLSSMHHDSRLRWPSVARVAGELLLDVRAVLDVLPEIADVAADFLARLQTKGQYGDEAEGEPFPMTGGVSRILRKGKVPWRAYQRFVARPLKFPQFWHCTVMCSAPFRVELNAGLC